jgi:hypothetical protein
MINSLFVMSPTGYVRSLSFPPSDFPSCPWTVRQIRVGMVRVRGGGKAGTGIWSVGQTAAEPPRPSTPLVPDPPAIHATQTPGGSISSAGPCSLVASVGYPRGLSTTSASSLSLSLDTIMPSLGCGPSSRQRERERKRERESRLGKAKLLCSAAETLKRDTCFQRALGWVSSSPDDYALISACATYHPFSPFPGTMLGNLTAPPLPAFPYPSHPTPLPVLSPSPDSLAQGGAH